LQDNVTLATSALVAVTRLVSFLSISAGLLSAIGLYLVLAFVVHQRRRATAIRTALGASRPQVMWQHFKTSGVVMLAAVPVGLVLSLFVRRYLPSSSTASRSAIATVWRWRC
jgi:ABC-type antimicrobial peptide transport system permease subunit